MIIVSSNDDTNLTRRQQLVRLSELCCWCSDTKRVQLRCVGQLGQDGQQEQERQAAPRHPGQRRRRRLRVRVWLATVVRRCLLEEVLQFRGCDDVGYESAVRQPGLPGLGCVCCGWLKPSGNDARRHANAYREANNNDHNGADDGCPNPNGQLSQSVGSVRWQWVYRSDTVCTTVHMCCDWCLVVSVPVECYQEVFALECVDKASLLSVSRVPLFPPIYTSTSLRLVQTLNIGS